MRVVLLTAALALLPAANATAQCEPETFDGFGVGQIIMNQIPGVTVSAQPGSCPSLVSAWIVEPLGGTLSGTRALGIQAGCPDFSPDYLRLLFDEEQSFVRFVLGVQIGGAGLDVNVRAYNSGGGLIDNQFVETASGTRAAVVVAPIGGGVRRVEIEQTSSFFETIDDLEFDQDTTPPSVEIDSPAFDSCVCDDAVVSIVGAVDDKDGAYECDTLFYRAVNADADEPWVTASTACGPFTGTLHTLSTAGLPAGRYYVRVTGANTCGLESSDVTVIRVDRSFGTIAIAAPAAGAEVCGDVEIEGTISDGCGVDWVLEVAPQGSTAFTEIASGTNQVTNCRFAVWDTTLFPDGPYTIRLRAEDSCGHADPPVLRDVIVDNSGFCLCSPDINGDGFVDFVDLLLVLANWTE